ncbi:MAG: hypothetical protein HQK51_19020 [Oligoflexia bacterium]|nr:hypothetical protein [Oligoflexia bacterium]
MQNLIGIILIVLCLLSIFFRFRFIIMLAIREIRSKQKIPHLTPSESFDLGKSLKNIHIDLIMFIVGMFFIIQEFIGE